MKERFETFTVLINRISRNIRKIKNQAMSNYNLRSTHVSCLYYLYTSNGLTATELCERCEEDKATISRALDHLEKNGYLSYKITGSRRYKSPLVLTDVGRKVGGEIADQITAVLEAISVDLADRDRTVLYRSLDVISKALDTIAVHPKAQKNGSNA